MANPLNVVRVMGTIILFRSHIYVSETVTCPKDADCRCVSDEPCVLNCIGKDYCKGGHTLTCRASQLCTLLCSGEQACTDSIFVGNGASTVSVVCTGGKACSGNTEIECARNGPCSVTCDSGNCESLDIAANAASSFECTGNGCSLASSAPAPYAAPTSAPSSVPSLTPSANPSTIPSELPTRTPSSATPTRTSSVEPTTAEPTRMPSLAPSSSPSPFPTTGPTFMPSFEPSFEPKTLRPTVKPTVEPSGTPTVEPTPGPSLTPSATPTRMPSVLPTNGSNSDSPWVEPTPSPSLTPSADPTKMQSVLPTNTYRGMSTAQPTASNRSTTIETQSTSSNSAFLTTTLLVLIGVLFVGSVAIFCTIIVLVKITKRDPIRRKTTVEMNVVLGDEDEDESDDEREIQVDGGDDLYTDNGTHTAGEHTDPLANDFLVSSGSPSGNGRPTGGATNGRCGGSVYEPADGDQGETREGIGSFAAAGYKIPDDSQW